MARQARIVLPDTPHHIMQRSMDSSPIFTEKEDFKTYLNIMRKQCDSHGVSIWAYALLPNQIHLIAMPQTEKALSSAIGEAHRQFSAFINEKTGTKGARFQNRFYSYAMDEKSLLSAAKFIETLPVISKIAPHAENYLWSSARRHLKNREDILIAEPILTHFMADWKSFLDMPHAQSEWINIQSHLSTGRPRGDESFLNTIENTLGRSVRARPVGRPKKKVV